MSYLQRFLEGFIFCQQFINQSLQCICFLIHQPKSAMHMLLDGAEYGILVKQCLSSRKPLAISAKLKHHRRRIPIDHTTLNDKCNQIFRLYQNWSRYYPVDSHFSRHDYSPPTSCRQQVSTGYQIVGQLQWSSRPFQCSAWSTNQWYVHHIFKLQFSWPTILLKQVYTQTSR